MIYLEAMRTLALLLQSNRRIFIKFVYAALDLAHRCTLPALHLAARHTTRSHLRTFAEFLSKASKPVAFTETYSASTRTPPALICALLPVRTLAHAT